MKRMWHFDKLSFCIPTKQNTIILVSQLTRSRRRRLFCSDSSNDSSTVKHQINPKPKIKLKSNDINPIYDGEDIESRQREKENALQYNKNIQAAIYATKLGAVANLALASTKGMAGVMVSSTALIADAANSFGDLLCDAVVYYTVTEARKTATPDRPWGRGKIESIGALSVGGLLFATALGIGYTAIHSAMDVASSDPFFMSIFQSYSLEIAGSGGSEITTSSSTVSEAIRERVSSNKPDLTESSPISWISSLQNMNSDTTKFAALSISGLSVIAKESLFRYTLHVGKKANSAAVIANAWQHRSDVGVSAAVFAGLVGSYLGYPLLDPLAGICVAGVIVRQAIVTSQDSLQDLSDVPAGEKETESLRQTCLNVKGIKTVKELKARKSGPFLFVEVTVGVLGTISASAAHRLAELTRQELLRRHKGRVANAVIHVAPLGATGLGEKYPLWARDHDFIVDRVRQSISTVAEVLSVSEVQVYYKDNGHIAVKVDIVLPSNLTISQAHTIAVQARKEIEKTLPGIADVDIDLELDETS